MEHWPQNDTNGAFRKEVCEECEQLEEIKAEIQAGGRAVQRK